MSRHQSRPAQACKTAHKDTDARATKKNVSALYGSKNHVNGDRKNKLIRKSKVADAGVHECRELANVLDPRNDSQETWADGASRLDPQEARLKETGCTSNMRERADRRQPLTPEHTPPTPNVRVRAWVEHIFGHFETAPKGCDVRTKA